VALGRRTVTITGNRMSAWMLPPDWERPVTETLAWATDVQQSIGGGEADSRAWLAEALLGVQRAGRPARAPGA
jgi:hypothetical protein